MLPNISNSLCPLSHNTHTDSTHTTHTEHSATHDANPDGEHEAPEAETLGGDSGKESPSTSEEFDFDAFYELATRVLNGDTDAMANLKSLKDRWEHKFKMSKNPALKSVTGRPSTPFRPRISLLPRRSVWTVAVGNLAGSEPKDGHAEVNQDCSPNLEMATPTTIQDGRLEQSDIYIGNVKLQAEFVDTIAGAFLQSSRKTLHFVPPTKQNGEIVIRPTQEVVDNGSQKWRSTAVGYFLGKRPYFPQVEAFVRSNWKGLQHVSVSSSGFFFFRFFSRPAMEDVIEGGPWLFQGQPIVLQPWEQGMSLRQQKHTQIPVWIRLRHLPMEYWTDEGLSTVASGVGTPLYTDGITKDCSRLDFARVCVMLDFNSPLPKHLVVISPVLRNGKEDPRRIDVEYEWLPQRCKNCCSLGHVSATCPANMKKPIAPPITIFVQKQPSQTELSQPEQRLQSTEDSRPAPNSGMDSVWTAQSTKTSSQPAANLLRTNSGSSSLNKGKDIELHNSYSALAEETRVSQANVQRTRRNLLNNWSWFEDYSGPAGRIWLAWDSLEVVDILEVGTQFIHCRTINKRMHTWYLITVIYGDYDIIPRRELWRALRNLSTGIQNEPWLILGDFNAVMDDSEVCGQAADTSASMVEFQSCVRDTSLVPLPFTGCPYTWHNCSEGPRKPVEEVGQSACQ
ncbi:UNVERIFIED_CONTAM: hypothetical protein Scaly_2961100 [Sesamum calycinum]|uniref:DUF4283 domain-containing protein n=1 Tax=Sesamum calycinum TaxID=2727403 RepID=A0AAW2KPZ8_9LAMI